MKKSYGKGAKPKKRMNMGGLPEMAKTAMGRRDDRMGDRIDDLRSRMEGRIAKVRGKMDGAVGDARDRFSDRIEDIRAKMQDRMGDVRERLGRRPPMGNPMGPENKPIGPGMKRQVIPPPMAPMGNRPAPDMMQRQVIPPPQAAAPQKPITAMKKGGMVRGCGVAKRGVKKAKSY